MTKGKLFSFWKVLIVIVWLFALLIAHDSVYGADLAKLGQPLDYSVPT